MADRIKDLSLLLIYLSGWEEDSRNNPGEKIYKSWKGYRFETLNRLEEEKMIRQFHNGKMLILTPEGLAAAKDLGRRYLAGEKEAR